MPTPPRPFVSIVMPALNEERYIAEAISSVVPQSDTLDYELLVLDGGSSDRTREIVRDIASRNERIKLLHNERRIQSAAVNVASEACDARTAILIRADCHAKYPEEFAARCVDTLSRTGSSSVVVAMQAVGHHPTQKAIAAAQNSRLGNGGSQHRVAGRSGYVDHGHHAAFDLEIFRALGGYDETAPYNEDAEFDTRLIEAGGRIYLDGSLTIEYYPRSNFRTLATQYFRHGWGRANTILKHGKTPKLRQLLPVLVLVACVGGLVLWPLVGITALLPLAFYLVTCLAWATALAVQARDASILLAAPAAVVMHMSWATGFLVREFAHRRQKLVHRLRDLRARFGTANAGPTP
ncbi:glycosyltransferase family 2 protein [Hyphomicrobium sp. CS1GBMeth3]|uniref:glycosyltransferase family 2 protein n=1 Tax=Hyphomicrobium sp. CS1GBMeth3 TaxID=1892845 RepID=UPI000A8C6C12|nr:glycosyltransferase family 2 protein [Hyphomicrobium sp. CS1GBMeth3]